MEYEEQNAILSKHIDSLNSAIRKMEDDKTVSEQGMKILEPFLKYFQELLSRHVSKSGLSDVQPTYTNIKECLVELSNLIPSSNKKLLLKIKEMINGLDYPK